MNKHTSVFPWQGVAVRKASGVWRVRGEVTARLRGAVPVHLPDDPYPFCYKEIPS
ncbi:hypothetical protein NLX83_37885 [Allokutzneria sp. A3M-2-11 16]|uniref:hypothetical protein n=1 Tax=Allokutzneria sp. A3M-2-11 16 TaxID=2962043 RepID=UPI0020B8C72F|nr:hypothetical protein [Allokutzneria sp. A3M-2-11 16]MCP3805054.1 hypothetical protein [Allokutzneria sp. A3M-2-11 16]